MSRVGGGACGLSDYQLPISVTGVRNFSDQFAPVHIRRRLHLEMPDDCRGENTRLLSVRFGTRCLVGQ